jgi:hypothetical protein
MVANSCGDQQVYVVSDGAGARCETKRWPGLVAAAKTIRYKTFDKRQNSLFAPQRAVDGRYRRTVSGLSSKSEMGSVIPVTT